MSRRGGAASESHLGVFRPGLDDMTLLSSPTPNGIRDNLKERLGKKVIYTYIGQVLVAMNPFTWLNLYGAADARRYMRQSRLDVPPHVFAIAEAAFRAMTDEEESQCVIISGESGAGKTEARSTSRPTALCSAGTGSSEVERVKKVFLESNLLLEAFGNAKTLRNNNSSRFGKYFELLFDKFGTPKGGVVTNYLLEKSRTVKPGAGERNFHIFYQLVGDAEGSSVRDASPLEAAARLLGLDAAALTEALGRRVLETMAPGGRVETYDVPLNPTQAALARDALIKSVFSKLFDHLVSAVNDALDPQYDDDADDELLNVGVLDIYGFEIFDRNGFEQLSINFVNEKLQQIFIALTLKAEQEEYVAEGIEWKEVKYFNNRVVCELIEAKRPPGVLLVLDDVCKQMHSRPGSQVDAKFQDTVCSCQQSHRHFAKAKRGFVVKHYVPASFFALAGDVTYDVNGFAESNRDELRGDLLALLLASGDGAVRELYEDEAEARARAKEDADRGRGGRKGAAGPTAGRKIRDQCGALVAALMQCEPHYVRCVKSNDDKRALACDERVSHQCKYLGLPENVRVRRAGFCYRTEYHRFLERFKTLSRATYPREWTGSDRDGAREIVRAAAKLGGPLATLGDGGETQFGRSKLFVKKPETYFALEKLRDDAHARYAAKISRAGRRSRICATSSRLPRTLYVLEDRGPGAPFRRFALRRVVDVDALRSVAVSTRADGVVVVSCGAPQDAPKAVKADLVKSGAWQKNGDVLECPASGKKFGVFGARRHHCRSSGRIYAAEACEARQAFPDRGWPKPERVRDDLFGLEPCDALEDLVLYSERRSELVGVLLRANGARRSPPADAADAGHARAAAAAGRGFRAPPVAASAPPPAAAPAAADPARKEDALDDAAFVAALGCDRSAFAKMPKWKQDNKKKKAGLF
ncbi:hypothetical protein JL720_2480 [Aureococcus anophagefferens]|nr:hypothetical protein JL720_2480 [Aureococcus anophagefferens]